MRPAVHDAPLACRSPRKSNKGHLPDIPEAPLSKPVHICSANDYTKNMNRCYESPREHAVRLDTASRNVPERKIAPQKIWSGANIIVRSDEEWQDAERKADLLLASSRMVRNPAYPIGIAIVGVCCRLCMHSIVTCVMYHVASQSTSFSRNPTRNIVLGRPSSSNSDCVLGPPCVHYHQRDTLESPQMDRRAGSDEWDETEIWADQLLG